MAELPSGNVTFLFTDVEGSTKLLERDRTLAGRMLHRHHELLREAVEGHSGYVFETVGDAVYAVFAKPSDALAATCQAQLALQAEDWGEAGPLRVRMGLHTGEVELRGGHYFGPALFRCARLAAIGHGGQMLLSGVTAELAGELLPADTALKDLGSHRLKDLAEPEHVFQLVHPDLPHHFPTVKSLHGAGPPRNMPLQLTSFVGRENELNQVKQLLAGTRLLTLTGPGGVGKTRLAVQVANEMASDFTDGIYFASLAPLRDARLILSAIARSLGLDDSGQRPLLQRLQAHIGTKSVLLVADNFEQLVSGASQLTELLVNCPALKFLVTSRERLNLAGEQEIQVPPLLVPDRPPARAGARPSAESASSVEDVNQIAKSAAVVLFRERARAVDPGFELNQGNTVAVADICRRLDGLPLAIELAAARIRFVPPQALLKRLESRFAVLTDGPRDLPERQRTLRQTVEWSYELLDADERQIFARLAVFVGGSTLDAAEAVCDWDDLSRPVWEVVNSLVDKSLLRREEAPTGPRLAMLETVRELALERLAGSGVEATAFDRHAAYFLGLTDGRIWAEVEYLDGLEVEHDNLRGALRWYIDRGAAESAQALGGTLWLLWANRGYLSEGRDWLAKVLDLESGHESLSLASALYGAGLLALRQGDLGNAQKLLERSVAVSRRVGGSGKARVSHTLSLLGRVAHSRGQFQAARALHEEGLLASRSAESPNREEELRNRADEAANLRGLAAVALEEGSHTEARDLCEEALGIEREERLTTYNTMMTLVTLGDIAVATGDYERAGKHYQEALRDRGVRYSGVWGDALGGLGYVATLAYDLPSARELVAQSLTVRLDLGDRLGIARGLEQAAALQAALGQPEAALQLAGAAEALRHATGAPASPSEQALARLWASSLRKALPSEKRAQLVKEGRAMAPDQAVEFALARCNVSGGRGPTVVDKPAEELTSRERELMLLMIQGLTNRQIAERLVIGERTVETHARNILGKLGLPSRNRLTTWASQQGLLAVPSA